MGTSSPTFQQAISVAEAAQRLGVKPWDVMRLIESGALVARVVVDPASLDAFKEAQ